MSDEKNGEQNKGASRLDILERRVAILEEGFEAIRRAIGIVLATSEGVKSAAETMGQLLRDVREKLPEPAEASARIKPFE